MGRANWHHGCGKCGGLEVVYLVVHSILAAGREALHDCGVAGAAHSRLRQPGEAAAPQV